MLFNALQGARGVTLMGYCAIEDSVGNGYAIADIGCSGLQKVRRIAGYIQARN